jgi:transcriptional regulator of acetoin/glycerol metabolism
MVKPTPAAVLPPRQLRAARRELLETGRLGLSALDEGLGRSWLRSRDFGLSPLGRPPGAPHASAAQLRRALEQQHELVSHARPVMEDLQEQTRGTDSLVILADARGLLLHALGDGHFVDRAQRVALRPGAIWDERWRGTNAIGTALAEQRALTVLGSEHYLERNGFLSCTAAPIRDPQGRVLGVLDISGEQRGFQRHTLALLRSAVRMIEHRLFETRHAGALRLQLHAQPEGLGTPTEGLLALSEDGWVLGCNAAAQALLGTAPLGVRAQRLDGLLPAGFDQLMDWAVQDGGAPRPLRRDGAPPLWLRVQAPRALVLGAAAPAARALPRSPAEPAEPADALAALDSGDPALQQAIARARRVMDKPIPLLLQGESGVGKELFARAVHDSGPRRGQAFVALNCAALPEQLIEAELFGYRPGAFTGAAREGAPGRLREAHGGTLFLDEIGDMPLVLQARLLRVLQDRQVQPLGAGAAVAVDFQLLCATHRPLRQLVAEGRFREDLYYRLNGLSLSLPPLRERQDQAALVARLLAELSPQRRVHLDPTLAQAWSAYRWPGNVRQLHQALRTACALLEPGEVCITRAHLPEDLLEELDATAARPAPRPQAPQDLRAQSRELVAQTLADCQGNVSEAARRLGIGRNTLYRKLGRDGG